MRAVSVFGSPAIGRHVEPGSSVTGTSPVPHHPTNRPLHIDPRKRKVSAPSSLHPFVLGSSEDLNTIEDEPCTASGGISIERKFSMSAKDVPKHSKKVTTNIIELNDRSTFCFLYGI